MGSFSENLWVHFYGSITITTPIILTFDPKHRLWVFVNWGLQGYTYFSSIFDPKHTLWVLLKTA